MASNSISVAVRIRPLTPREQALLVPEHGTSPFAAAGSFAASTSGSSGGGSGAHTTSYVSGKVAGGQVKRNVKALDERVLIFDPEETNTVAKYQKLISGQSNGDKKVKDLRFCFDRVFDESATQDDVFDGCAKDLVPGVFEGYNGTVFAYGATGCGKTHTISGSLEDPGIIFKLAKEVFDTIEAKSDETTCEVTLSYLEVYNENIRDLLIPSSPANLILRESRDRVTVPGLSEKVPTSALEVVEMIHAANANRTTSPTEANAVSSRSHAVLSLNVKQKPRTAAMQENYTLATLSVIDLAGSERAAATNNSGARLNEGANINKSLLALGSCINALCDPKQKAHVPYRDSKLTRLLKHSLGGNCRTLMLVCVSPTAYFDTLNTLNYANRAKQIQTKITQNVVTFDRHVGEYVRVIYELRQEIEGLKRTGVEGEKKAREKAWKEIEGCIAQLHRLADAAKEPVQRGAGAAEEIKMAQIIADELAAWTAAVSGSVGPGTSADPSRLYPVERYLTEFSSKRQQLAAQAAAAAAANTTLEKGITSAMRRFINPLGTYAQQYPEMLHLLKSEAALVALQVDSSSSGARSSAERGIDMAGLLAAVASAREKVATDITICGETSQDRREQLERVLHWMDQATMRLYAQLLHATAGQTSPNAHAVASTGIVAAETSRKRTVANRSPPLFGAPFASTSASASTSGSSASSSTARPPKAQRMSSSTSVSASAGRQTSLTSSRPAMAASTSAAAKPAMRRKISSNRLSASTASTSTAVIGRRPSNAALPKEAAKKGVVWKDDAGQLLTEEHSRSAFDYSDVSTDASTSYGAASGSSAVPRGPATPPAPAGNHSLSILDESAEETSCLLGTSALHVGPPRVPAEVGNDSVASSAGNLSSSAPTNRPSAVRRLLGSVSSSSRSNTSAACETPASETMKRSGNGGSSSARRQSSIGPVRSAKKKTRMSIFEPGLPDTSLASGGHGIGSIGRSSVGHAGTVSSGALPRAGRMTASFQHKMAANVNANASFDSGAGASTARKTSDMTAGAGGARHAAPSGVQARVAASRARRGSMATAVAAAAAALPGRTADAAASRDVAEFGTLKAPAV